MKLIKLRSWLEESKTTQRLFAEKIGIDPAYLSRLINGKHTMGLELADKIVSETGDKISFRDLLVGD